VARGRQQATAAPAPAPGAHRTAALTSAALLRSGPNALASIMGRLCQRWRPARSCGCNDMALHWAAR
jgi:hypothetical protein